MEADSIDFSKLKTHRKIRDDSHFEEIKRNFQEQIATVMTDLEKMQPNMRAAEHYDEVLNRYKVQSNGRTAYEMATLQKCRPKALAF